MSESSREIFWPDDLPYKPLFAVKSTGSAWCFAPTKIRDDAEFELLCRLRITSFASDCNLFGCHPRLIGTYSWSSTGKVALNNIKTSSDYYWLTVASMKDGLHDLKIKKAWNVGKTYMKYSCWLDGEFQLEGIDVGDNAASQYTGKEWRFGVFAESNNSDASSDVPMRPTKCPTGVDIQVISLETDTGMQFDMRAALDGENVPCFYDMTTKRYVRSQGDTQFVRVDE